MVCFSEALNIFCLSDLPAIAVLNCTDGVIDITYANFGRSQPYDVVCSAPRGLLEHTHCYHSIADQFLPCHGATACVVPDLHDPGIDACPNTGKYIQISYICTPGIYKDHGPISDQT